MTKTLKVIDVSRAEGPLYTTPGEDGPLTVFDSGVTVLASDDKVYRHTAFRVPGALAFEGYKVPNYNYKAQVEAFADKVRAKGVIDLRYWTEVVEETWAEREAYNLRCEAEERGA